MATITAHGKTFEAADGTRLVNALEDNGVDILHRCGGLARCTTCRVTFTAGEPADMHPREKAKLEDGDNVGAFRLACHVLCGGDMAVEAGMLLSTSGLDDAGPRCSDEIPADD